MRVCVVRVRVVRVCTCVCRLQMNVALGDYHGPSFKKSLGASRGHRMKGSRIEGKGRARDQGIKGSRDQDEAIKGIKGSKDVAQRMCQRGCAQRMW